MTIEKINWPARFQELDVLAGSSRIGRLSHHAHYVFSYMPEAETACSLIMPLRPESYNRGQLHPIFEMNLPEGFLRRYISERLLRYTKVNDMLFLALQSDRGIGHLSYKSHYDFGTSKRVAFDDLLKTPRKENLFGYLLEHYGLTHTLSGIQPKLMVETDRSTMTYPNCIVKTGDEEFEHLAVNEFVCMRLAKLCGLDVPNHYLSDDHSLFVIERFDLNNNQKIGFEDFCCLMGISSDERYSKSYETAAKILSLYGAPEIDLENFYKLVIFNCCIGNGDAHLKNFGLLYDPYSVALIPRLAPAYDLTCTLYYEHLDNQLALKLNRDKKFPNKTALLNFGKAIGIKKPEPIFDLICTRLVESCDKVPVLSEYPKLAETIRKQTAFTGTQLASGIKLKPSKRRKYT